jgi:MFS transporter, ACS family, glucarate transporter
MPMDPSARLFRGLPIRYLLVTWILILAAIAYLDRTNVAIAGVQIGRAFGIDDTRLGWVFSAFLAGYAAFQIPGGVLVHRLGPRRVLTIGLLWWGAFTAVTPWISPHMAGALSMLLFIRFFLGAGEAILYPSGNQFVECWFPLSERGRATGIVFGGSGLGSAVAPPLLTAIIFRFGWHVSFWFCAALGALAAVVWYVVARDTPESHPWVTAKELAHIESGREDGRAALRTDADGREPANAGAVPWRGIFTSRSILAVGASYFAYGYVTWIYFGWFYLYLAKVRGLSLRSSAFYSIFPFAAMAIASPAGGVVSDWLTRRFSARAGRCLWPAFALGLTAALVEGGSRVHHAQTASLVLACGAGALYLSQSSFFSFAADFAGRFAGVVTGAVNMCCQIGGAVTATLTPLIAARFGWQASFSTAMVLVVFGALAWLAVDPGERLQSG